MVTMEMLIAYLNPMCNVSSSEVRDVEHEKTD